MTGSSPDVIRECESLLIVIKASQLYLRMFYYAVKGGIMFAKCHSYYSSEQRKSLGYLRDLLSIPKCPQESGELSETFWESLEIFGNLWGGF